MTATLMGRAHVFERGDKIFITTPVTLATPTDAQIDEYAFASAVKTKAPNENIGWLQGKYVEAGRPNLNNAMWLSNELALKSLTPMLMPVTVMHDPRTAVGVIADCKFVEENSSARIDNVLAIWRHRFGPVWDEAASNIDSGTMMESMECYAPWYTCSTCEQAYVKLPQGAEQASWCDHLRSNDSWRILRDVCFTGTGLIFGTRGGVGAYTEAHLDHFRDEIAEAHDRSHHDSTYRPTPRSTPAMALVQIEDTELARLKSERDTAQTELSASKDAQRELTTKLEKAEADKVAAETAKATAEAAVATATETANRATLKTTRLATLGSGFMAKFGDTTKAVLNELAAKASDEDWELALKEREEMAGVKRDSAEAGAATPPAAGEGTTSFSSEELASFMRQGTVAPAGGTAPPPDGASSVRALAGAFRPTKTRT